jgi:hypothetical protein
MDLCESDGSLQVLLFFSHVALDAHISFSIFLTHVTHYKSGVWWPEAIILRAHLLKVMLLYRLTCCFASHVTQRARCSGAKCGPT